MSTSTPKLRRKFRAAARSATVWFSAAVPALLAAAEALKDGLPGLAEWLTGWKLVAASVVVSALVAWLRVRNEGRYDNDRDYGSYRDYRDRGDGFFHGRGR